MRIKYLILALFCSSAIFAQVAPSYKMTKKYSVRELEEWLKKNVRPRFVNTADFDISAQINTGWTTIHDMLGARSQVGRAAGRPSNKYNADLLLDFSYVVGRAWVLARTSFRNSAGLFGGTTNSFSLNRAYIGYHFTTYGPFICDGMVGRNSLTKIYNSQLQYDSTCDGASLITSYMFGKIVDLRAIIGVYIQGSRAFYIVRGGLFNIANIGLYYDYTYTHWGRIRPATANNGLNIKFNISQFLVGWEYKPKWLKKELKFFAALLKNTAATITNLSKGSRASMGGYVGMQLGTVKKQKDFSIQGQLQYCALQAVAPWDVSGISNGTAPVSMYNATSSRNLNGRTNFKGWEVILNYALTNQITLTGKLQRSVPFNKIIGQPFNYTSFKLESQYVF